VLHRLIVVPCFRKEGLSCDFVLVAGSVLERRLWRGHRVLPRKRRLRSLSEGVIDPGLGTTFDSLGEAYDFYNLYSWQHGFGIRYGKSRLNVERAKCMQEIVSRCSVSFAVHVLIM
jgi:hypothetical protein